MKKILIIIWAALHIALVIDSKTVQADQPTPESGNSEVYSLDQGKPEPRPPEPRTSEQDSPQLKPPEGPEPGQESRGPNPQYKRELKPPKGFKVIPPK